MQAIVNYPKIRIGNRSIDIFPYWIALLFGGIAFGLVGAFVVLTQGLQVTGLSNKVPWVLWITIDLSSIALGGSAFVFGVSAVAQGFWLLRPCPQGSPPFL